MLARSRSGFWTEGWRQQIQTTKPQQEGDVSLLIRPLQSLRLHWQLLEVSEIQDVPTSTGDIFSPSLNSSEWSCGLPTSQDQGSAVNHDISSSFVAGNI